MSKEKVSFTVNNDELEKISKRLYELKKKSDENVTKMSEEERKEYGVNKLYLSEEELIEYSALNRLNLILVNGNNMLDSKDYIYVDGMRVSKRNLNKFYELGQLIHVKGLDISRPPYLGEILPGTKRKMPRLPEEDEEIPAYEAYLTGYYKKLKYAFDPVEYYENTTVPKPRTPYPHEMYFATANGYKLGDGTKHPYYRKMVAYYKALAKIEYDKLAKRKEVQKMEKEYLRRMVVNPGKIDPTKVVGVENLPGFEDAVKKVVSQAAVAQYTSNTHGNSLSGQQNGILGLPETFTRDDNSIADINHLTIMPVAKNQPKDIRVVRENPLAGNFVQEVDEKISDGLLPIGVQSISNASQDTTLAVKDSESIETIYEKVPKDVLIGIGLSDGLVKSPSQDTPEYIASLINTIEDTKDEYPEFEETLEGCMEYLKYCMDMLVPDGKTSLEEDKLLEYADEILPLYGISYGNGMML